MILTTLTALHLKKKLTCAALMGGTVFGAGLLAGAALAHASHQQTPAPRPTNGDAA